VVRSILLFVVTIAAIRVTFLEWKQIVNENHSLIKYEKNFNRVNQDEETNN